MQRVEWSSEFEIGINVIDAQHQRIVDYINMLVDFGDDASREEIAEMLNALMDYTYSHFAFEEALMEEAQYQYLAVHRRTHESFIERVNELHQRFKNGENVCEDIGTLLQTWLINHIKEDDQGYAPVVKKQIPVIENKHAGSWFSNTLKRFFQ
jgi:hemerythrin